MASTTPDSSPPSLEDLSTRGATALLLPWILNMAAANDSSPREIAVFVHQPSRSVTLVEGSLDVESLLRDIPSKDGPWPATKASIESLPRVQISEAGLECSICLSEFEVNVDEEVKEMPCRHRFHSDCIDRWLGIHGSCPICRYGMPVDERKVSEETGGWRIHVFFARGRRYSDTDTETNMDTPEHDDAGADENESPAQHMDIE